MTTWRHRAYPDAPRKGLGDVPLAEVDIEPRFDPETTGHFADALGVRRRGRRRATAPPRLRRQAAAGTRSSRSRPYLVGSWSDASRETKKYSTPAGATVTSSRASSPRTLNP